MSWGNYGFAGSLSSAKGWEAANPTAARRTDPRLEAARRRAQEFANDMTYTLPNGKMVTHVMDPFGGQVRMLLEDIPTHEFDPAITQANNKMGLELLQLMMGQQR